ncbi:MAG: AAA family ATPase [Rhodoferax sp.]|uniref:AAA family ATPase n=1 Tax=Rhodoferax sp. TaxID=50421 RepID=UPI00183C80F6|nr:AAA family ATPase [Rhodoferax sp.]NMM15375.1 AAA family ATPase [Rhodoferax sp.]
MSGTIEKAVVPTTANPNSSTALIMPTAEKIGNHTEARRLHALGFKLCRLEPMSKKPVGDGWQTNPVRDIEDGAYGYGAILAKNNLCSIDPDNVEPARVGLSRCGFDLDELMAAGVRTTSTRPGSGGRSTFKAPQGVGRVVFSSATHGTILELRAGQSNLQDCLPGTVYRTKDGGGPYEQHYAGSRTLDAAPALPARFLAWWQRVDSDLDFCREQQLLFCGLDAMQSISKGSKLAFTSGMRRDYNAAHDVTDILERHAYTTADGERWAPSSATGAPCVRAIPGKDGLWQSDHASDPLHGTFDAWIASVVLDHSGDMAAAERAYGPARDAAIADDFEVVGPSTKKPRRFKFIKMSEFKKRSPMSWLIKRVFPKAEIGAVFGESGAGKSFFVLDLVLAIARGADWNGHKVTQGNVAYVVAEGASGFSSRTDAYASHYGMDMDALPFRALADAPNVLDRGDVDELLAALGDLPDLKVVVLDTLAQVTPGANENSAEDMGRALAAAKHISRTTGATVLIVAHAGKDTSRGLRGWSGIKAALDFEINVERTGDFRSATITKMKDGDGEGIAFPFRLENVQLGVDDEGNPTASCVVNVSGQLAKKVAGSKRLTIGRDDVALAAAVSLRDLTGGSTVTLDQWKVSATAGMVAKPGKADNRVRDFSRAVEVLTAGGYISMVGNRVEVLRDAP